MPGDPARGGRASGTRWAREAPARRHREQTHAPRSNRPEAPHARPDCFSHVILLAQRNHRSDKGIVALQYSVLIRPDPTGSILDPAKNECRPARPRSHGLILRKK